MISQAFYMLTIAKSPKSFIPDYAVGYLDLTFSLSSYYPEDTYCENVQFLDYNDFENEHTNPFDEEERFLIEKKL